MDFSEAGLRQHLINFSSIAKQNLDRDGYLVPTLLIIGNKKSNFLACPDISEKNVSYYIDLLQKDKHKYDTQLVAFITESNNRHQNHEYFSVTITIDGLIATYLYPFTRFNKNGKTQFTHHCPVATETVLNGFISEVWNG